METIMMPTTERVPTVKEEIKKRPLASNFFFGLLLLCVENLAGTDFVCPCEPVWNCLLVGAFFIVPTVIVFLFMCNIQGCKCKQFFRKGFMYSFIPATLWVVFLFFDGRYMACAMTSWSGKYELLENSSWKWCEPFDSAQTENAINQTKVWYSISQFTGIMVALVLAVMYQIYRCSCFKKEQPNRQDEEAGKEFSNIQST